MAASLALTLVGCSTETPAAEGEQTLTVGIDVADRLTGIVDKFEATHEGIRIKLVGSATSYNDQMQTLIAADSAPDVIRTFPGIGSVMGAGTLGDAGVLLDLSAEDWASKLSSTQTSLFGSKAGVNSVPLGVTGIVVAWNDQALEAVDGKVPTTYSELLNLCAVAQANGKVTLAEYGKGGNIVQSYAQVAPLVYGPDPAFTDQQFADKATFTDSGWKTAFEQQLEMGAAGCYNEGTNGTDWTAASQMVANGEALGVVTFSDISGLASTAPAGVTWTVSPFPTGDDADNRYLAATDSTGFGINAKSKNVELAKEFIAYLATEEAQNLFAEAIGGAPSIPNDSFKPVNDEQNLIIEYVGNGRIGTWPNQGWPSAEVVATMKDGVQQLFNGTMSPEDVTRDMDDAFAAALAAK